MNPEQIQLPQSTDQCSLGILHLKRYWEKNQLKKTGEIASDAFPEEWNIDITLLAVLGLGLEQTIKQLYTNNTDFQAFENWIMIVNDHHLLQNKINEFNEYILNRGSTYKKETNSAQVLNEEDIECWNEHGYVIIRDAIPKEDCENAINVICDFIRIERDIASTWYQSNPYRQGIMVQLFQHPELEKNRQAPRIRAAYEQLWNRKDLWLNTDRAGFNPPETENWKFPGPRLHWDVSLALPIPFGLQGILYLSDTKANQGAFTLVPGFQHKIESWLHSLPAHTDPRNQDIYSLGAKPIEANAGDFIIWHHALPHGSSPNNAEKPRFVQYINYAPLDAAVNPIWK